MCGRMFRLFTEVDIKKDQFLKITEVQSEIRPDFNVTPGRNIPIVIKGSRILDSYHWGLIPVWAKEKSIGYRMINAKSETLTEKPSFKNLIKKRRCLVLASGFYEWDKSKHPHAIQIKDQEIIAFAGLWDEWTDKETNKKIRSCTIITCPPNKFMEKLHHRMPVILKPDEYNKWLESDDFTEYRALLRPINDKLMTEYEVSKDVNTPKNNKKDLLEPVKQGGKQRELF